jgi:hypothetical protein
MLERTPEPDASAKPNLNEAIEGSFLSYTRNPTRL